MKSGLHRQLLERAAAGTPIRVGLIGAGKFGSMYLAQIPRTPGVHLVGIADLRPRPPAATSRASAGRRSACGAARRGAEGRQHARRRRLAGAGAHPAIDVVVECTGIPIAAVDHCLEPSRTASTSSTSRSRPTPFAVPLLAQRAAEAGVVYSLAFGDQPAADLRPGRLGPHLRLFRWWRPDAATSGCRTSRRARPTPSGATTA
jgi:predicted homoserine dehydrogenase-like protein